MGQTGPTAVLSLAATETKGQSFRHCPVPSPGAGVDGQPSLTQEQREGSACEHKSAGGGFSAPHPQEFRAVTLPPCGLHRP